MGHDKDKTKQTTGSMPRESSQVGTHGQTGSTQEQGKDWGPGQGSQNKGQGQYRGEGLNRDQGTSQGKDWGQGQGGQNKGQGQDWNDRSQRDMQQGDQTMPAQPSGTSPLDKDQQPVNQTRPVQQNR